MINRHFAARGMATVALALGLGACTEPQIVRVYNGDPVVGRFIRYEAYAAYGRGIEAEHDGYFRLASRWYEEATQYDPESVEIWTRLGIAYCDPRWRRLQDAQKAFEHAEQLDANYEPLFRARARCAQSSSTDNNGLGYAKRAVELDPDQDEAVTLYAELLLKAGKGEEAKRLLESHLLRHPNSVPGWRARYDLAKQQQEPLVMKRSAEAIVKLAPRLASELVAEVPSLEPLAQVDEAVRQGNLDAARKAARLAHLPPGELAVRAVALGAPKLALEQAELVLGADPSSGAARVAMASAGDALASVQHVSTALEVHPDERLTQLSPLARLIYAELLARRVDREAARAFAGAIITDKTNDPVHEAVRTHLLGRIGGTNASTGT